MPIGAPTPPPPAAPPWFSLLTKAMQTELLSWLRVRKVDTSGWSR